MPDPRPGHRYGAFGLYRRVLRDARPFWGHLTGILVTSVLATPLALLTPFPLKLVVDSVVGHQRAPGVVRALTFGHGSSTTALLVFSVCLFVLVRLLVYVQSMGSWLLQTWTGEQLVLRFRERLFSHVQRLSISHHDSGTTQSTYRIQYDAPAIQAMAVTGLTPLVTSALTLAGMIYVTARLDPLLAVMALVVMPALVLLARTYSGRMRDEWAAVKENEAAAMSVVQEALAASRIVKAFGQESREQQRFVGHSARSMRGQIKVALLGAVFDMSVGLVLAAGTAAVLYIGTRHVLSHRLELGELLIVMGYMAMLYEPLETATKKVSDLQASIASAERVYSLLDEEPEVLDSPAALPIGRAQGELAFENVSFSYGGNRPVLDDVSFAVPAGTRVGIVGTTGSGKTTLVSLLVRFYDPSAGCVRLDGRDLRDYRLADLRRQFSIVLQEPVLFSTTIEENIAYARPGASHDEIVAAAEAAGAHDFITRLPDGYATLVGERGMRLSGGERQRVSIARAFLKDAPVLILDEPTSSVDTRTEAAIMASMGRLMEGRTAIVIAHRTTTVDACDVVLRLERGRLVALQSREEWLAAPAGPGTTAPAAAATTTAPAPNGR